MLSLCCGFCTLLGILLYCLRPGVRFLDIVCLQTYNILLITVYS